MKKWHEEFEEDAIALHWQTVEKAGGWAITVPMTLRQASALAEAAEYIGSTLLRTDEKESGNMHRLAIVLRILARDAMQAEIRKGQEA